MGSDCANESCECGPKSGACAEASGAGCPACGTACGGDPAACATAMWGQAFFCAMKEVHVEILKAKIQKAWGPKMDKAADAVLEAMGVKWQSMMATAKAQSDLQTKLRTLFQEK